MPVYSLEGRVQEWCPHYAMVGSKRDIPNASGGGKFPEGALAEAFKEQQSPAVTFRNQEGAKGADGILPTKREAKSKSLLGRHHHNGVNCQVRRL